MLKQFNFAFRDTFESIKIPLFINIGLFVFFFLITTFNVLGLAGKILAITMISLAYCYMIIGVIIGFSRTSKQFFDLPHGYLINQTPVDSWKKLLSYGLSRTILDLFSFFLCAIFVVLTALTIGTAGFDFSDIFPRGFGPLIRFSILPLVMLFLFYLLAVGAIFLQKAIVRSLPNTLRFRGFLGTVAIVAILYLCNLLFLALGLFGEVHRIGFLFSVSINTISSWIACFIIFIAEIIALYSATSYLLEKRVNL